MKKILLAIPLFLLWILIFILTSGKRADYIMGESRGMHVVKSEQIGLSTTEYTFDPNRKPEREYITWREFWSKFGYYNK